MYWIPSRVCEIWWPCEPACVCEGIVPWMIYGGLSLAHKAFGMGRGFTLVEAAAEFCMRLHPARPCRFYPPSLTLVPPYSYAPKSSPRFSQTGGTLYECGLALKSAGASAVSCFVAHGVFPKESWKRFLRVRRVRYKRAY